MEKFAFLLENASTYACLICGASVQAQYRGKHLLFHLEIEAKSEEMKNRQHGGDFYQTKFIPLDRNKL